ncbi:Fatty-acid amide hydrolase 2, partial [Operophtera brumata]
MVSAVSGVTAGYPVGSLDVLAEHPKKQEITSEEVVAAYIDRCKEVNTYVNAIVEPRYDAALREARSIDKMIASSQRSVEELQHENPAKKDADIIRQARAAGAIPIAVTNTPQLCMSWETYNNSALISAGASLIGLGSDIAGSLRLPPMFTGIYGHKPTPRLLSVEDFEEYFALGPITRYAEDLSLMLKVLKQPGSPEIPFDKPVDISKLKFYYMESDGSNVSDAIGPDVRRAMDMAREHIKRTYNIDVK